MLLPITRSVAETAIGALVLALNKLLAAAINGDGSLYWYDDNDPLEFNCNPVTNDTALVIFL